jgi:hypothetical protein
VAELLVQIGEGGLKQLAMAWVLGLLELLLNPPSRQTKVLTLSGSCCSFGSKFHSRLCGLFSRLRLLGLYGFALPATRHILIIVRSGMNWDERQKSESESIPIENPRFPLDTSVRIHELSKYVSDVRL